MSCEHKHWGKGVGWVFSWRVKVTNKNAIRKTHFFLDNPMIFDIKLRDSWCIMFTTWLIVRWGWNSAVDLQLAALFKTVGRWAQHPKNAHQVHGDEFFEKYLANFCLSIQGTNPRLVPPQGRHDRGGGDRLFQRSKSDRSWLCVSQKILKPHYPPERYLTKPTFNHKNLKYKLLPQEQDWGVRECC